VEVHGCDEVLVAFEGVEQLGVESSLNHLLNAPLLQLIIGNQFEFPDCPNE
jgi:hypothetical protein